MAEVAEQSTQAAASQAARIHRRQDALQAALLGTLAVGAHRRAHLLELGLRFVHR